MYLKAFYKLVQHACRVSYSVGTSKKAHIAQEQYLRCTQCRIATYVDLTKYRHWILKFNVLKVAETGLNWIQSERAEPKFFLAPSMHMCNTQV